MIASPELSFVALNVLLCFSNRISCSLVMCEKPRLLLKKLLNDFLKRLSLSSGVMLTPPPFSL